MEIEIYFRDLTPEKQAEILDEIDIDEYNVENVPLVTFNLGE